MKVFKLALYKEVSPAQGKFRALLLPVEVDLLRQSNLVLEQGEVLEYIRSVAVVAL